MPNPNAQVGAGKNFVRLSNFSRGEHRKSDAYDVPEGWANALRNWYLTDDGSLILRRGTSRWNATSLGTDAVRGSVRAYPIDGSVPFFVACHGTVVYVGTDSTKTFASSRTGLSATASFWFTQHLNYLYASNGVDAHQKLDVNTQAWTPWGVAAPTSGPLAAAGVDGELAGSYKFKVTFKLASGAESNGSPAGNVLVESDAFTRVDNNALGTGWTEVENLATAIQVLSNQIRITGTEKAYAKRTGTYGNNQYAKLTFKAFTDELRNSGPAVRVSGTVFGEMTGYTLIYSNKNEAGSSIAIGLRLYKSVAGTTTLLGTYLTTLAAGHLVEIRVSGTAVTAYLNDVQVITATDSGIATGVPGVAEIMGTGGLGSADWDTFEAGNVEGVLLTGVVSKQVDLTGIPLGPTGVTSRRIYGFKDSVSSVYNLIAEIVDNTTTTYSVTTDQDAWTTAISTDNDPPPAKAWISAFWKGRLLMAGDSDNPKRWYFSKAFVPANKLEAFPLTNFLDIPLGDGDEITAVVPSGDIVYVFGNEKVFYISGSDEFTFAYHETFATAGCSGPWAVDKVALPGSEEVVVFLSRNGFQTMSGLQSVVISEPEESLFSGLPKQTAGRLNYAQADKATVKFYDKLKAVFISFPVGTSTVNNFSLWWFVGKGFVEDSRASRQLLVLTTSDSDGQAFAWDLNDGILREVDVVDVYADDGVPVSAVVDTGYLSGGQFVQELSKLWQWLTFVTNSAAASVSVALSVDEESETQAFIMDTNRDERVGLTGRRLRAVATFTASAFFRLSEVAARFTSRRTWRPR